MSTVRPIDTRYRGYRFRSRLEARYAVLFDALGLAYEYEREGYDLGWALDWYLPDFWLPGLQCFAEVKPDVFTPEDFARAAALGTTLLLDGMPEARLYHCTGQGHCCDTDYARYLGGHGWGAVILDASVRKKRLWFDFGEGLDAYALQAFHRAVDAARSARFEHGEHGR